VLCKGVWLKTLPVPHFCSESAVRFMTVHYLRRVVAAYSWQKHQLCVLVIKDCIRTIDTASAQSVCVVWGLGPSVLLTPHDGSLLWKLCLPLLAFTKQTTMPSIEIKLKVWGSLRVKRSIASVAYCPLPQNMILTCPSVY